MNIAVPLFKRPLLSQAGVSVHGQIPEETYRLPNLWCLHLYEYRGELTVEGQQMELAPGRISLIPPGRKLQYRYRGPSRHLYAHFRFSSRRESAGQDSVSLDALTDAPRHFSRLQEGMHEVIRRFADQPLRAEIRFWDLLWTLAEAQAGAAEQAPAPHPVFLRARDWIELHLSEPIQVGELARHLSISANHLTRLFHQETGDTVIGYLQSRRATLASHLLLDTDLPIQSVGILTGHPDPHHFNKFIHRRFGCSPRALRTGPPR